MSTSRTRQLGVGAAAIGVLVAGWLLSQKRQANAPVSTEASAGSAGAVDSAPMPRSLPRRAPRPRDGGSAAAAFETDPSSGAPADPAFASDAAAALVPSTGDAAPGRVTQLTLAVMREAVLHDWVITDERGSPCAPQNIRILFDVPADLKKYTKGAYFEPLGPAPTDSTDEINGLLLCEGSTFQYLGFEGFWRADRGQWDVFPFPVVE